MAIGRSPTASRWTGPLFGAGIPITTLGAFFTGFLLPGDQLALSAVTVGSTARGYTVLFDQVVLFVLIGGVEISPSTLIRWLGVHILVMGSALGALLLVGWRRQRAVGVARQ